MPAISVTRSKCSAKFTNSPLGVLSCLAVGGITTNAGINKIDLVRIFHVLFSKRSAEALVGIIGATELGYDLPSPRQILRLWLPSVLIRAFRRGTEACANRSQAWERRFYV